MLRKPLKKMMRNYIFSPFPECFTPAVPGEAFQRVIPTDDSSLHILDHDADVDGFDDVLAKILQVVIFRGLLLQ